MQLHKEVRSAALAATSPVAHRTISMPTPNHGRMLSSHPSPSPFADAPPSDPLEEEGPTDDKQALTASATD